MNKFRHLAHRILMSLAFLALSHFSLLTAMAVTFKTEPLLGSLSAAYPEVNMTRLCINGTDVTDPNTQVKVGDLP